MHVFTVDCSTHGILHSVNKMRMRFDDEINRGFSIDLSHHHFGHPN